MKKFTSVFLILIIMLSALSLSAFAWEEPELVLAADYNAEKGTVTVYYDVMNFAGTESADFSLKYNDDVLEYVDNEREKHGDDFFEMSNNGDTITMVYANLYYVAPEDCRDDGSATVCKLNFKIKDKNAAETVFIATTTSYNVDPDSTPKQPKRATLKIALNEGSLSKATDERYTFATDSDKDTPTNTGIAKVIVAACIAAAVLIGGTAAVVIKYRKPEKPAKKK